MKPISVRPDVNRYGSYIYNVKAWKYFYTIHNILYPLTAVSGIVVHQRVRFASGAAKIKIIFNNDIRHSLKFSTAWSIRYADRPKRLTVSFRFSYNMFCGHNARRLIMYTTQTPGVGLVRRRHTRAQIPRE